MGYLLGGGDSSRPTNGRHTSTKAHRTYIDGVEQQYDFFTLESNQTTTGFLKPFAVADVNHYGDQRCCWKETRSGTEEAENH